MEKKYRKIMLAVAIFFGSCMCNRAILLAQTKDCSIIKQQYKNIEPLVDSLRKQRKHVERDSLYNVYINRMDLACPCDYWAVANLYLGKYSFTFHSLNRRNEALEMFTKKIEECTNKNDSTTLFLNGSKAIYHLRNDEFYKMKKHLDEAIRIGVEKFHPAYRDLFVARMNLGLYYHYKGDDLTALDIHINNEKNIENVIFRDTLAHIDNLDWCVTHALTLDDDITAEVYLDRFIKLVKGTRFEKKAMIGMQETLFDHYINTENYAKAKEYFDILDKTDAYNDYFRALPFIRYLIYEGKHDEAAQRLQKVDSLFNKNNVPLHHFARINVTLEKMRNKKLSEQSFKKLSEQVITSIHNNYLNLVNESPSNLAKNIQKLSSKYVAVISRMLNYGNPNDVPTIYNRMNNVKNASSAYYVNLQSFINNTSNEKLKNDFTLYKKLTKRVNESNVSDSLRLLSSSIHDALINAAGVKWHNDIKIKEIQQKLGPSEVFLDFYQTDKIKGKEELYLFIVSDESVVFHNYKNIVDTLELQLSSTNYTNNGKMNKALYHYLIKPIEVYLKDKRKLYISPDGKLNQIAIEILSPTGSKQSILEDYYQIVYVENSRTIVESNVEKTDKFKNNFLLVGGINYQCHASNDGLLATVAQDIQKIRSDIQYLEGSKKEVDKISEKLKVQNLPFMALMDCDATKEKLITAANSSDVTHIHISTHGLSKSSTGANINKYFTSNSSAQLILAQSYANDDAYLSALEVINQNVSNKELVFLSACNTGQGTYMSGFGNASVANAFKKAGAKKVVATLWPIPDDVTVELCDHFYTHYLKSYDANAAMQHAKKILRSRYSPEQWAAFRVMN